MIRAILLFILVAFTASGQVVLVKPYVQPGDGATLDGSDVKVLTWVTDARGAEFTVQYAWPGGPMQQVRPERVALDFEKAKPPPKKRSSSRSSTKADDKDKKEAEEKEPDKKETPKDQPDEKSGDPKAEEKGDTENETKPEGDTSSKGSERDAAKKAALTVDELKESIAETFAPIVEREQHYIRYRAVLRNLPFDTTVGYSVKMGNAVVREARFKTRASATRSVRFIAVGDMASNKIEQREVAYQMALQSPDFLVALGDIVYPGGRVLQYMNHFFPCYNDVPVGGPKVGAALAAVIPIYPVIGNHDADMQKFPVYPDAYAAYYFFSVPKNGPGVGPWNTPLGKDEKLIKAFKAGAGNEYPYMGHYSFDYGPGHFLVLDANSYSMHEMDKLEPWIERDLSSSRQPWKFVCFHQPAFHTSREHYTEQRMRLLEPVFEKTGVDVVFAGHVHNYQRSKPLKFTPNPPKRDSKGRVNGELVLDETFDGVNDTTPEGIIHIVSGGGGAKLYSPDLKKTIAALEKDHGSNYKPLTAAYIADKHSFSVVDLKPREFVLRQISSDGKEVDRIRITK